MKYGKKSFIEKKEPVKVPVVEKKVVPVVVEELKIIKKEESKAYITSDEALAHRLNVRFPFTKIERVTYYTLGATEQEVSDFLKGA